MITGAAGFIGSHLCDRFIKEGYHVIGMDNLITGNIANIEHLFPLKNFEYYHHDVSKFVHVPGQLDYILHFASPASPIDYLKIDQSFVRDLINNPDDAVIATAIIGLSHNLHMKVIAEGVETVEVLDFLAGQKCDIYQGYYYSRPVPVDDFFAILQREKNQQQITA